MPCRVGRLELGQRHPPHAISLRRAALRRQLLVTSSGLGRTIFMMGGHELAFRQDAVVSWFPGNRSLGLAELAGQGSW